MTKDLKSSNDYQIVPVPTKSSRDINKKVYSKDEKK